MGGQGALRLAFRHPDTFPVVAAVAPAIDYQHAWEAGDDELRSMYTSAESARQDTAILHVHPLYWPRNIWFSADPIGGAWFDSADRLHMKLFSLGIPHEYCAGDIDGGSHAEPEPLLRAIHFAAERLEKERLRMG
jgi:S-formylglutathione hydrolase